MTIQLPAPVATYFETDYDSGGAIADCFAVDAVVKDEGKTHTGRAAIGDWMMESWEKYRSIATPIAIADIGDETVVTANCVGNFPGSPLDIRFHFRMDGDKISALRCTT
jgi:hypothetical protein